MKFVRHGHLPIECPPALSSGIPRATPPFSAAGAKKKRRGRPNQCVILSIPMQRIERDQLIPGAQRPRSFKKPPKKCTQEKKILRTTAPPARPRARFARRSRPLEVGVVTAATVVAAIVAAAVAASSGRATSCPLLAKCCQKTEHMFVMHLRRNHSAQARHKRNSPSMHAVSVWASSSNRSNSAVSSSSLRIANKDATGSRFNQCERGKKGCDHHTTTLTSVREGCPPYLPSFVCAACSDR